MVFPPYLTDPKYGWGVPNAKAGNAQMDAAFFHGARIDSEKFNLAMGKCQNLQSGMASSIVQWCSTTLVFG